MGKGKVNETARRPRRSLASLVRERNGATVVEFAFVAPVCVFLVCVFIDLCMVMFITNAMEGGLREASRYAITGYVDGGLTREQRIRAIILDHSYKLINEEDIEITYKVYPSFKDVGQPEPFVDKNGNGKYDAGEPYTDVNANGKWDPDMGAAGIGGSGDIVAYIVTYKWVFWTPLAKQVWGNDGVITLAATVAVKNEPF